MSQERKGRGKQEEREPKDEGRKAEGKGGKVGKVDK